MAQPYHALQQLLEKLDAAVSPATIHGLWCGRVAAGDKLEDGGWWQYSLQVMGVEGEVDPRLRSAFEGVAGFAEANLQQDNFSFEPWLPADTVDCRLRVAALGDWCRGFIEGVTSLLGQRLMSQAADVTETLQDLLAIGEVDPDVPGDEEDEKQLYELTEFVKVAALNLYQELAVAPAGSGNNAKSESGQTGPTLH